MRPVAAAILVAGVLVVAAAAALGQSDDLAAGRRVFEDNCAVCHGANGDGRGHAAHHFATAPRDLTSGRYKIRSTGSGQPPTDADLRRSIVKGLPGTGMVPPGPPQRDRAERGGRLSQEPVTAVRRGPESGRPHRGAGAAQDPGRDRARPEGVREGGMLRMSRQAGPRRRTVGQGPQDQALRPHPAALQERLRRRRTSCAPSSPAWTALRCRPTTSSWTIPSCGQLSYYIESARGSAGGHRGRARGLARRTPTSETMKSWALAIGVMALAAGCLPHSNPKPGSATAELRDAGAGWSAPRILTGVERRGSDPPRGARLAPGAEGRSHLTKGGDAIVRTFATRG